MDRFITINYTYLSMMATPPPSIVLLYNFISQPRKNGSYYYLYSPLCSHPG